MALRWRERVSEPERARIEAAAAGAGLTTRQLDWVMGDPGAAAGMAPIGLLGRPGGVEQVVEIVARGWVGQPADGFDRPMLRENLALSPEDRIRAMAARHAALAPLRGAARR